MTLQELINKLNELKKVSADGGDTKVHFFAEEDYNAFDVEISGVELEHAYESDKDNFLDGDRIFLS